MLANRFMDIDVKGSMSARQSPTQDLGVTLQIRTHEISSIVERWQLYHKQGLETYVSTHRHPVQYGLTSNLYKPHSVSFTVTFAGLYLSAPRPSTNVSSAEFNVI